MYKFTALPFYLSLIFVLIFSCQDKEEEVKTWSIVASGEKIILPLNDETSNISMGLEFFKAEKSLLFSVNEIKNSLQIYDLEDQTLEKELVFEREGALGIGFEYFHVHTLDSIFLFPPFGNQMVLTDTSGRIKNRIRFELPESYFNIFPHNSYYVSPPNVDGKELVVKVRAEVRPSEITQEKLESIALSAAINLETGAAKLLPHGFPSDYLSSGQKQLEYSFHYQNGRSVVSFMGEHRLYIANRETSPMESKEGKSQYLEDQMPFFSKDVDSRGMSEYAFAKSRYESLIFDSYRKVYYRFAYPSVQFETNEELRALRNSPGPFVVMVFDENLNLLTETKFEAGTYYPTNFFVGEKGLFISLSHPENPEIQEDEMAFELFNLLEK